jgi:transposase
MCRFKRVGLEAGPLSQWLYSVLAENDLRATLRNFGLKVGMIGTVKFERRIRELVENLPDLAVLVEPLLIVRRVVREQLGRK